MSFFNPDWYVLSVMLPTLVKKCTSENSSNSRYDFNWYFNFSLTPKFLHGTQSCEIINNLIDAHLRVMIFWNLLVSLCPSMGSAACSKLWPANMSYTLLIKTLFFYHIYTAPVFLQTTHWLLDIMILLPLDQDLTLSSIGWLFSSTGLGLQGHPEFTRPTSRGRGLVTSWSRHGHDNIGLHSTNPVDEKEIPFYFLHDEARLTLHQPFNFHCIQRLTLPMTGSRPRVTPWRLPHELRVTPQPQPSGWKKSPYTTTRKS